jgi:hypothetical protein
MKQDKCLPLGSVVLLEGGTKKVMIIGYCMKTKEEPDKIYDYCGCVFPEGVLRSDITCVFDQKQIKEVCFSGYENEEAETFLKRVEKIAHKDEPKLETLGPQLESL